jgi:hypothetical protein
MRVDDHPSVGKITNPTRARESELEREIWAAFLLTNRDISIFVSPTQNCRARKITTSAPTVERLVVSWATTRRKSRHTARIIPSIYWRCSFVMSHQRTSRPKNRRVPCFRKGHRYWAVRTSGSWMQISRKSSPAQGLTLLFWHTPFKHIWYLDSFGQKAKAELPTFAVYDIGAMARLKDQQMYHALRFVSAEE